jgi:two-component system, chemotaxis family, chemotaxis protein CheY
MKAMVIDDSRAMRAILKGILRQIGFEVAEAADGQAALEQLKSRPGVDVVLVDWHMPVMDGPSFVKALRSDAGLSAAKVLMCSSESEVSGIASALEVGANDYIIKPFTKDALEQKLEVLGIAVG